MYIWLQKYINPCAYSSCYCNIPSCKVSEQVLVKDVFPLDDNENALVLIKVEVVMNMQFFVSPDIYLSAQSVVDVLHVYHAMYLPLLSS